MRVVQTTQDAEKWIALIKQCSHPTELTAELLNNAGVRVMREFQRRMKNRVVGFIVIPPLIDKWSKKVYKASLKNEEIDFDDMGPEIIPNDKED